MTDRAPAAQILGTFLAEYPSAEIPAIALETAKMLIASTLASAALGFELDSSRIIRETALTKGSASQSAIWFSSGKVYAGDAARANAVASDAAASDDSDLRSIMHCGTPLTATILALAPHVKATGQDLLAAMVLGYEAAGRMNSAIPSYRNSGFHGATLTIFAATVAAGRLLHLTATEMTHAIVLAATSASGITMAARSSVSREYHAGQAVANGVEAARVAKAGYQGEPSLLEMKGGFFELYGHVADPAAITRLTADLGRNWDILQHMAIKLVPGGHPFHAFAQAAAEAARALNVAPEDIADISISRPNFTQLPPPIYPKDLVGMAQSASYFAAAGAVDQRFDWTHAQNSKINDPRIQSVIAKVRVAPPPTEGAELYRQGAKVTITSNQGAHAEAIVYVPKGAASEGLDWQDIAQKCHALLPAAGKTPQEIAAILAAVQDFDRSAHGEPLLSLIK